MLMVIIIIIINWPSCGVNLVSLLQTGIYKNVEWIRLFAVCVCSLLPAAEFIQRRMRNVH